MVRIAVQVSQSSSWPSFQACGACAWRTGTTSTECFFMDIFGLDFVGEQQLLGFSDLVNITWLNMTLKNIIIPLYSPGNKYVPNTMSKAHDLAVWIASTIGLASLAGQFYIHQYNNVIFIMKSSLSVSVTSSRHSLAISTLLPVSSLCLHTSPAVTWPWQ